MEETKGDINNYAYLSAIMDEFFNEGKEVKQKESEAGKIGGKKRNKRVKDLTTGIIYDSLSDFAAAYGKSSAWASKYKDKWEKL